MKNTLLLLLCFATMNVFSQTVKILFDATKAESAGNADWIIDADVHNIGWNPDAQIGNGDESNAQRFPNPSQSNITSATSETYWKGGISNWGIDCVKQGYEVESLPYNANITYGDGTNLQDLSNYQVFVVCEPNILFNASEKTAILNYVQNGGSLFMISDHDVSDRNGDGYDSPGIWNDLMAANPFGISFNLNNYSQTSTSVTTISSDSIANGPFGQVTEVLWSGGTDMTINTGINPSVKGVVFKNGYLNNNSKVMFAYARYGSGKIAAMADSSPADDGSGDVNDILYNGYITDANGNHRKLIMNATVWLADNSLTEINESQRSNADIKIFCDRKNLNVKNNSAEEIRVTIFDIFGNNVVGISSIKNTQENTFSLQTLNNGIYFVKAAGNKIIKIQKIILTD